SITWGELLQASAAELGSEQEARWLCEHASGLDRGEFDAARDDVVSERCGVTLWAMVARRLTGEPLQYVMRRWAFRHLDVFVDNRVLIPRPETEIVAQVALDMAIRMQRSVSKLRIADLGTGSDPIRSRVRTTSVLLARYPTLRHSPATTRPKLLIHRPSRRN
ncbi:MAG: hypothetical protein EBU37_06350, partial [Actinobacteria bacterium]|nr:hypothetical protein [Actinomycetota bacterium]